MKTAKIAVGQINTIVGDLSGNRDKILFCIKESQIKDADMIVFPELTITGYPPEDLLLKPTFIKENLRYLNEVAMAVGDIIAVVGFVDEDKRGIYNSAAVIYDKKIIYRYHKIHLPNYGVFDEKRYFQPGLENRVLNINGFCFMVNICEDIWVKDMGWRPQGNKKPGFLVNISASPYYAGKIQERRQVIGAKAKTLNMPVVYCNLVGGQDELVFDGRSTLFTSNGKVLRELKAFEEDLLIFDSGLTKRSKEDAARIKSLSREEEIYSALVLGVTDYVKKNNFNKVTFGISGGIDSGLVAMIAVDALGKENVLAISMPSRYSSAGTQLDAERIARNLGIRFCRISIDDIIDAYLDTLASHFKGMKTDKTEENIQARIRGNILMAFSNKFGYLVLNTGNKSETSVGYCTLYGDMAGGFAVIKDVPKKLVYELAAYRNDWDNKNVIPESVFKRPPSAELRPGQKDQDILPPYSMLDKIIDLYVERDKALADIVKKVGNKNIVKRILNMIDANEYKRRQAPVGIKITPRSFGKDRRMPITNKFAEVKYDGHDK